MRPRSSLFVAALLVTVGALRFATDTLHELDPEYWRVFEHSWVRYVIRAPSDGSWLGWLNAQCFKVLSVPSGISLIFLRSWFDVGTPEARQREFEDWAVRGVWIFVFWLGFTVLEWQKTRGPLVLVEGEQAWLNHVVHLVSAGLAWWLSGVLRVTERDRRRQIRPPRTRRRVDSSSSRNRAGESARRAPSP